MGKTKSKSAYDACQVSIINKEKVDKIVYGNPQEGCRK